MVVLAGDRKFTLPLTSSATVMASAGAIVFATWVIATKFLLARVPTKLTTKPVAMLPLATTLPVPMLASEASAACTSEAVASVVDVRRGLRGAAAVEGDRPGTRRGVVIAKLIRCCSVGSSPPCATSVIVVGLTGCIEFLTSVSIAYCLFASAPTKVMVNPVAMLPVTATLPGPTVGKAAKAV